jgi:hypothetical protein
MAAPEGPGVFGHPGLVQTYTLPKPVFYGDVIMNHPDGSVSDVIRFVENAGPGQSTKIQFFSDFEPFLPNAYYESNVKIAETLGPCTLYDVGNVYYFCSSFSLPAVSVWGLSALTLVLLTGIAIKFGRRHATAVAG